MFMDLMKHVSTCLSDRVKLTVDRVCSSSVTVVESALCFEFSFFHLPVVSGSSLYCHGHFGRRKSFLFLFLGGWECPSICDDGGFASFRILIC